MKPTTALRLRVSLWFACTFLVITPYLLLLFVVVGAAMFSNFDIDKLCVIVLVGLISTTCMCFMAFFVSYLDLRTREADEKELRRLVEVWRGTVKMYTFGLIG